MRDKSDTVIIILLSCLYFLNPVLSYILQCTILARITFVTMVEDARLSIMNQNVSVSRHGRDRHAKVSDETQTQTDTDRDSDETETETRQRKNAARAIAQGRK